MTTVTNVNGFQCKNCTDIDYARKHIDPAHPKDGPYGINASPGLGAVGKAGQSAEPVQASHSPAVRFGGALQNLNPADSVVAGAQLIPPTPSASRLLDLRI